MSQKMLNTYVIPLKSSKIGVAILLLLDEVMKVQSSGGAGKWQSWVLIWVPLTPRPGSLAFCVFRSPKYLQPWWLCVDQVGPLLSSCVFLLPCNFSCSKMRWWWSVLLSIRDQAELRGDNALFDQKTGVIQGASATEGCLHQGQWFSLFCLGIGFHLKLS